ncbi:SIP domain-containing protein [Xylophilus rhododendri]|uniref:SIP domain-containing protein n=1 Tax=Xylophilus rhododendri TaxID=2697032 RepID=A0A857J5S3_9BURK|nr:siderophore-interacting protein [Xylophilus rhododendri]QHI98341.1 SIP domain-containing protein [Xylophilus rhododendri]
MSTESVSESLFEPVSLRRVQRVRHDIVRRELRVLRVEPLGPSFRRVVLGGPELHGFVSASFDDHLKFITDPGTEAQAMRDYTPRHYDAAAGELTLEFVLHGDGPASTWAAQAAPGQTATVAGPRGSTVVPTDFAWHLLVGDATALPAIARRLEELPAGTRAIVIATVPHQDDRRPLHSAAALEVQWVDGNQGLLDAVRALALPQGEGYAWCAGESRTSAALRALLVEEKGHDRYAISAAAYWKQGEAGHKPARGQ